jgi:alpha-1,6-mannosyltransferase
MHVADLTLFFAPHSGGVKRYLLAKRNHLRAQPGMRHSLLVPGPSYRETLPGVFEHYGTRIPGGGYRIPWNGWRWQRELVAFAPDVIEVADPYHLGWFARRAADELGIPLVAFAHSDLANVLQARCGALAGAITRRYLRMFYAQFDQVIAPSDIIANGLRDLGVRTPAVQPLGVDGAIFNPCRRDAGLRREIGLPESTRVLIFAGRMGREKNIGNLVAAFDALGARYHLLLVGGTRRVSLSACVTLLPYEQDSAHLARLLASADALVHAGVQETFGLVVLETMACGRPVVGVNAGAVAELIDDEVGVLAADARPASLCKAIERLYERDLASLGAAARQRVEQRYTWDRTFAGLIACYQALVLPASTRTSAPVDATGRP